MLPEKRLATCPTCKHTGKFDYLGEQHWPPELARKSSLPSIIVLWSCSHCHTTISEPNLLPVPSGIMGKTETSPHLSSYGFRRITSCAGTSVEPEDWSPGSSFFMQKSGLSTLLRNRKYM